MLGDVTVYENVPYRKIMVARNLVHVLLSVSFCYIFCFMGIMQCCLFIVNAITFRGQERKRLLTNFMTGGYYCLTAERFTHAQTINLKIDVMHWFHFF